MKTIIYEAALNKDIRSKQITITEQQIYFAHEHAIIIFT